MSGLLPIMTRYPCARCKHRAGFKRLPLALAAPPGAVLVCLASVSWHLHGSYPLCGPTAYMQKTVWPVLDFVQGGLHSRLELIRGALLMLDEHVGVLENRAEFCDRMSIYENVPCKNARCHPVVTA